MDNQGNNYTEEQKAIIAHRDGPAYVVARVRARHLR